MRVSKILSKPIISVPTFDRDEKNVYQYDPNTDAVIHFPVSNIVKENVDRYSTMIIELSEPVKILPGNFVQGSDGDYLIEFESGGLGAPMQGRYTVVITDNDNNIISQQNVVLTFGSVRALLTEYFLLPNSEGNLDVHLTGSPSTYGDIHFEVLNTEEAIKTKRAIHKMNHSSEPLDDSEYRGLTDTRNVLEVFPDGTFKAGAEGSATIGVHIISDFAEINKVQLISISVDEKMNAVGSEDSVGVTPEELDEIERILANAAKQGSPNRR